MSAFDQAASLGIELDTLALDERTAAILKRRGVDGTSRGNPTPRHRGWLVRRALLGADLASLVLAYFLAKLIVSGGPGDAARPPVRPARVDAPGLDRRRQALRALRAGRGARRPLHGRRGRRRLPSRHARRVVLLRDGVGRRRSPTRTSRASSCSGCSQSFSSRPCRGIARAAARRSPLYLQNTIIIGAGHIGQLVARKLLQHPEYRINLVGFVDAHPRPAGPSSTTSPLARPPRAIWRDRHAARRRARDHRVLRRRPRGAARR